MEWEKLKSVPFHLWQLKTIFGDYVLPVSHVDKKMKRIDFLLEKLPRDELNLIVTLKHLEILKNILPATTISDIIKLFGVIILITCYKFPSHHDMWYPRSQYKYIGTPAMANKVLTRPMFDNMGSCIQF